MSKQIIYQLHNVTKKYDGGKTVLNNVSISMYDDAKIGLLGPNGSGKSTLMKIMAGVDTEFQGEAKAMDGIKIGYLQQEPQLDDSKTVRENVLDGVADRKARLERFNQVGIEMGEDGADFDALTEEMTELQNQIEAAGDWDLDRIINVAMDALRCPPGDWPVTNLSGGEKRRVALARLLLSKPDMLLLDEPTNHLDAESNAWLQRHLAEFPGTVMMVTHDRYFLDNVTGWILELDRGRGIPYEGNYSSYLTAKAKRLAQESKEEDARQKTIKRELEWINTNPKARQSKSKARINAYNSMIEEAHNEQTGTAQITMPPPPRLGQMVIEAKNISKAFGDKLLIEDLSFSLPPGGIVGVIGPNGAGKTTLFKMITGKEQPDSGSFKVGETVQLGYVDQSRDDLDPKKNVWEAVSDGFDMIKFGTLEKSSRAYVGAFNFKGTDQQKKVGDLSGGERNRVHLARMLKEPANVLLLDEPTNDLDTETLGALEEAVERFAGCAVIISHDRAFLDRLATHILAFEGEGQVVWFEGNFEAYEADRRKRLGQDADQPSRMKYKKLHAA